MIPEKAILEEMARASHPSNAETARNHEQSDSNLMGMGEASMAPDTSDTILIDQTKVGEKIKQGRGNALGRLEIRLATTEAELNTIYRFRYTIYVSDFVRCFGYFWFTASVSRV